MPKPSSGSVPSSHSTGIIATTIATSVSFTSFTNHSMSASVIRNGEAEEDDHAAGAVADVADRLGEADDVDAVAVARYLARSSSSLAATSK
jgi:hypothetical protein